ncbi:MAG: hypothetical protein WBW81_14900, partial [Methylocella sp.]
MKMRDDIVIFPYPWQRGQHWADVSAPVLDELDFEGKARFPPGQIMKNESLVRCRASRHEEIEG